MLRSRQAAHPSKRRRVLRRDEVWQYFRALVACSFRVRPACFFLFARPTAARSVAWQLADGSDANCNDHRTDALLMLPCVEDRVRLCPHKVRTAALCSARTRTFRLNTQRTKSLALRLPALLTVGGLRDTHASLWSAPSCLARARFPCAPQQRLRGPSSFFGCR
jgi:hypothetical protein